MSDPYTTFIEGKSRVSAPVGFEPSQARLPNKLKPFQRDITTWALRRGRVALANSHASGSIDTLHAYFHNLDMSPSIPDLRDAWDAWENYLRLLHAARI